MLKYAGLLLIFSFFALGGNAFAQREREKIQCEEGFLLLIRTIRQGVAYFRLPIGEIFRTFSCPALEKEGFLKALNEKGLKNAFLFYADRFSYDDFTASQILNFSERLGKLPPEEQLAFCDRLIEVLERAVNVTKEGFPKKNKLYRTLGVSLGIGFVILLL